MLELLVGKKINELVSRRYSLNNLIKEGISAYRKLPDKWYIKNPSKNVGDYLEVKYKIKLNDHKISNIGYGELNGEFAFIPHDVNYSWEITEYEFSLGVSFE